VQGSAPRDFGRVEVSREDHPRIKEAACARSGRRDKGGRLPVRDVDVEGFRSGGSTMLLTGRKTNGNELSRQVQMEVVLTGIVATWVVSVTRDRGNHVRPISCCGYWFSIPLSYL